MSCTCTPSGEVLAAHLAALGARMDALIASHHAVHAVAEANIERRLTDMNELREQIGTERGLYMTRTEIDSRINAATAEYHALAQRNLDRIARLELAASNLTGRLWAAGVAVTFVMAVVGMAIRYL